jgi:hypothetical protein
MPDATTTVGPADVLALDAEITRTTDSPSYGVTPGGFIIKPFGRLLTEKLALARGLFGDDIDLTSGSVLRKLLEVSALEDQRTWAALGAIYANSFVATATGDALSRLGQELGLPRPHLEASGKVTLRLIGNLPPGVTAIDVPRGARMLTPGGHHGFTDDPAHLTATQKEAEVSVIAFYPGPEHNLDPTQAAPDGSFPQKLDRWHPFDPVVMDLLAAEAAGTPLVQIDHKRPLSGGELLWPDARYRALVLNAPRSLWTVDAIRTAVSLVPGVRQVQVRDAWGGLDIRQSIFGNFNFIERVFSSDRDLATPYYFTVLVAPTPGAFWEGVDGLRAAVESAIEDLRPLSIFPRVESADLVGVGVKANLLVRGLPLPVGAQATVNASPEAVALKRRLLQRVRQYVDNLSFGEPVRVSEVIWALMSEPGIADARDVALLRYPPTWESVNFATQVAPPIAQELACGLNVELGANQIAALVEDPAYLTIVLS